MSTDAECAVVRLPSVVDLKAVGALQAEFLAVRGRPLDVDARDVTRLGGLGLQVLMSAKSTWRSDANDFRIVEPSEDFLKALQLFGAPHLEAAALEEPRP